MRHGQRARAIRISSFTNDLRLKHNVQMILDKDHGTNLATEVMISPAK
jgi:hypothetical protein